ncbi:MAG: hypothetical protein ACKO2P_13540 [Planctomycetota bacterium]
MSRRDRREMGLIVDRLRRFVAGQTSGIYPQLGDDLQAYSTQCEAVNQRLQQCLQWYQQGFYLNAAAAAAPPESILEDCVQLEFPGADVLGSAAAVHGHIEPTVLQRDWVAALTEACEKKQQVETEQRLLRQLTLAGKPLPARLFVMRQIFDRDPAHPFLEGDIRQFERDWFREARTFCRQQPEELRLSLLDEILEDLTGGRYREKPPAALLENLREQRREVIRSSLPPRADALRTLHQQLGGHDLLREAERWYHEGRLDAFQTSDVLQFLQQADDWKTACESCGQVPDSNEFGVGDLLDHAQRLSRARKNLLQRQAAADALLQAIADNQVGIPQLRQLYQQAESLQAIDSNLERSYSQRVAWIRTRAVLRVVLLVVAVIGVLVGCIALAMMF